MLLFPFSEIMEVICLASSFFYLSNGKVGYWGYFRWFMLFTLLLEFTGYILYFIYHLNNHWLYNINLPVEIIFISAVLYKICSPYFKVQYWLLPGLSLFASFYFYESMHSHFLSYSIISNNIASVMIIIICCLYFYFFLKKEEYVDIYKHPPFWIIAGLFFFYFGSTACNIFYTYLASINLKQQIPVRFIIFALLNFILYSCWMRAFLCKYRQTI